jgi:hypothetical protein
LHLCVTRARIKVINKRWLACITIALIATACQTKGRTGPAIESGGLGLSRSRWERAHGGASSQDSGYVNYTDERGRYTINFMDDAAGYIKRTYSDAAGVTLEEARSESRNLIPGDSRLIRTYSKGTHQVDLYLSDSLKAIFHEDDWTGGKPGNFIVSYSSDNGVVKSFVVGLGNNP